MQRRKLIADRLTRLDTALAKADELRTTMSGAAREGGASEVDVLLARRRYQEVLLDRTQLDYDAYAAALAGRQAAALFPAPETGLTARAADPTEGCDVARAWCATGSAQCSTVGMDRRSDRDI